MTSFSEKGRYAVSVVIPTLGSREGLRTVFECLARQSLNVRSFEVVVVVDGCADHIFSSVEELVASFRLHLAIQLIRHSKNRGPAAARNTGARHARANLLAFTDDDCEMPALWLETHLKYHMRNPSPASVGGWYNFRRHDVEHNLYAQFSHFYYTAVFWPINLYSYEGSSSESYPALPANNTANLSVKRHAFDAVGGFDEDFVTPGGEDIYFAHRLYDAGYESHYIPMSVTHHRALGIGAFIRLVMNRGIGYEVLRRKTSRRPSLSHALKRLWRRYRESIRGAATRSVSVSRHVPGLLTLCFLFLFAVESPIADRIHHARWKSMVQKKHGD